MSTRDDLVAHLRAYADLGVTGVSRDPAWRARVAAVTPPASTDSQDAASDVAPVIADVSIAMPDSSLSLPVGDADAQALAQLPAEPAGLDALRAHIGVCMRCQLSTMGRKQVVFGAGNPHAELMFVGEGPGADEDEQGVPFVGQAGQLLTKIIAAIDFTRDDVYIANVVKCRPPGNRNPEPVEVATCSPFLLRQIDMIQPKVIVALGAFAAQTLLQTKTPISKLRGVVHDFRPGTKVIPTFHPSFLLRNRNNRDLYRDVWEDMKKARALLTPAG